MKKLTRILALLLAMISIVSMFAACQDKEDTGNNNDKGDIVAGTEEDPKIEAVDYNGYEFTFLTKESNDYGYKVKYLVSTGEDGNLLDSAIGRRNAIIEEKYNIKIKQYDVNDLIGEVRTQVMGGALSFDAVLANPQMLATLAREGYLYDLNSIDRFDMTKSYWDGNAAKELTMGGKLYFTNCSLNIHSIGTAIFFNKKLIEDYELTSPYEYIENNQWTLDNWAILAKAISKDVNNDGAMTELDQYSQITTDGVVGQFIYGSGIRFTTNDETGLPRVTLVDNSDKLVNIHEKVKEVLANPEIAYNITQSNVGDHGYAHKWEYVRTLFTQDLYLFDYTTDDVLTIIKDMESEFGIIPFPKYDENQDTYKTVYPADFNLLALPSSLENIERTANIIEDMNYYSSFVVEPEWFEKLLARRYARDDESENTLRFIKENRVYDIGRYFDFGKFTNSVLGGNIKNVNIMREYNRRKNQIESDINTVFKDFSKK